MNGLLYQTLLLTPYAAGGYFGQYKIMHKSPKITETLAYGYSFKSTQQELSNEYQYDRVQMFFKNLNVLVVWMKLASALEALKQAIGLWILPPPSPSPPSRMLTATLSLGNTSEWHEMERLG